MSSPRCPNLPQTRKSRERWCGGMLLLRPHLTELAVSNALLRHHYSIKTVGLAVKPGPAIYVNYSCGVTGQTRIFAS